MHVKTNFNTFLTFLLSGIMMVFSAFLPEGQAGARAQSPPSKKFKVVLDAGHGGKDSGNVGNGYSEKDIALDIVLALGAELEKQSDVEVVYTRKKDVFIDLWVRADIANEIDADLFISVHCNSHSSQAKGTETFVMGIDKNEKNMKIAKKENSVIFLEDGYEERYEGFDPKRPETMIGLELMQEEFLDHSLSLASFVEKEFTSTLKRKSRGVKQGPFWVLHRSVMPSILIETGFLTNNEEGRFLNSSAGRSKMAKAITKAVTAYKKNIQANESVSIVEEDLPAIQKDTIAVDTLETIGHLETVKNVGAVESDMTVTKPQIVEGVTFKIQLAASKRKLEPKPYNFKKMSDISRTKDGDLYKYYTGATSDYTEARAILENAKNNGYSSAFIVSFDKNDIKVPLNQVLN